jgi:Uri superfamily endonuclease
MKGIYFLIINVKKDTLIEIGALGNIKFKKGIYVYVGSAQNNLEKRIKRHLSKQKKLHWHIDYFLKNNNTEIKKVFYKNKGKKQECKTACFLEKYEEPIKKFGCSDCNCKSHLFRLKSLKNLNELNIKEVKNDLQMV